MKKLILPQLEASAVGAAGGDAGEEAASKKPEAD